MPKTQHLIRRRQTWYVRLRVPADLLEFYKPKKEIQRSLKTRDYKDALNPPNGDEQVQRLLFFWKKKLEELS